MPSGRIRQSARRLAADFALVYPAGLDMEGFPFILFIGFIYSFGTSKK